MAKRYDFGTLNKVQNTPQGGRLVPAAVTRVGVFPYRRADGTVRRELRHPREVFKEDSLASLRGAPVTDLHPPEMMTPENFSQYAIGHVKDDVSHGPRLVNASLAIQDKTGIQKLDNRERKECSLGYDCNLKETPGFWEGEAYDVEQTDIVYNHCAIGPEGWGRAGSEVSMRIDSKDDDEDAAIFHLDSSTENSEKQHKEITMSVKIDGIDYETGSAGHVQALEKQIQSQQVRADAAETELATVSGKLEVETKRADASEGALSKATDPGRLDSLVKERQALIDKARRLDSATDFDGLKSREIMVAALRADDADFDDTDRADAFIEGMFGMAVKNSKTDAKPAVGTSKLAVATSPAIKKDSKEQIDAAGKFRQDSREAWKQPLKMSNRGA